ncbi:MAG: hypothetical protein IAI48_14775 [Candidatus Eremiobacteraeota bacterium]|nr:hypothetical protein [Candidatus Eremiobacteraeota bacterium]
MFRSALALGILVAAAAIPARAAIETDPTVLYATMRSAYDKGVAKGWPFSSELYYESTVFDAGRAYALFRPDDPQSAQVAALAVDVATELHYDPLTNDDASLWYVLEAASAVAKTGDAQHRAEAEALVAALGTAADDPKTVAERAERSALANVDAFHGDADARVQLIVADVRAFNLTRDPAYRSALLQHAAAVATPIDRVPDPEFGTMFSIARTALADPGYADVDRAFARTIAERRAREPQLRIIGRVSAVPHELRLTRTAPADEYFGDYKESPLGVRNEVARVNKYLDKGWGYRMEGQALLVDSAVEDWQKQYPRDQTLPGTLLDVYELMQRVSTDKTKDAAARLKSILLVQYAPTRQAQELAS